MYSKNVFDNYFIILFDLNLSCFLLQDSCSISSSIYRSGIPL